MNRTGFLALTGALVALGGGWAGGQNANGKRSLWVWRTPLAVASEIAAFALGNHFNLLFVSIEKADREALAASDGNAIAALRGLGDGGRTLYGVAGDPSWVQHSRSAPPPAVLDLLDAHRAHGIFAGLALDVEPHTLPAWKDGSERDALAANYLQILGIVRSAAADAGLPVLATVHPTYAKYPAPAGNADTLLQSAARAVDATDLMAYRDSESTLNSFGGKAMDQLASVGKPWWLGVSTHSRSAPGTSYASLPAKEFFPAIDATAMDLANRYGQCFAGIAVEDYRNSVALLQPGTSS